MLMKNNILNPDFKDFVTVLNAYEVDYLLVGGYSVILHGYARTTGDMDIWVKATAVNYDKLCRAFKQFGMSVFDMTMDRFLLIEKYDVFTFGRPPVSIDIMTRVKGVDFDDAFSKSAWFEVGDQLAVRTISLEDLLLAKRAAGRPKDQDDIAHLLRS
jgi:Nucleotidyl transferase of unknown function (DUF2204)